VTHTPIKECDAHALLTKKCAVEFVHAIQHDLLLNEELPPLPHPGLWAVIDAEFLKTLQLSWGKEVLN
jgi:hypothetical protein